MRLWIGHYLGDPQEWFMVWSDSKESAIHDIDCEYGEPDVRSLKEIDRPGGMGLFARKLQLDEDDVLEEKPDYYYLEPNLDNPPIIERARSPIVEDWVKKCIEEPFGPPENAEGSSIAEVMGIHQAEVMATYTRSMCPVCHAGRYRRKDGCTECGFREQR